MSLQGSSEPVHSIYIDELELAGLKIEFKKEQDALRVLFKQPFWNNASFSLAVNTKYIPNFSRNRLSYYNTCKNTQEVLSVIHKINIKDKRVFTADKILDKIFRRPIKICEIASLDVINRIITTINKKQIFPATTIRRFQNIVKKICKIISFFLRPIREGVIFIINQIISQVAIKMSQIR